MKIVIVSIYPPQNEKHNRSGGVSSYTKNLVSSIAYGAENRLFVLCEKNNGIKEGYDEGGIKIIRCFDRKPWYVIQLLREIKKIRPDVIHIQQEVNLYGNILTAFLLPWLVFFLRKYRTIVTIHGVVSLKFINKIFIRENNSHLPVFLVKLAFCLIYKPLGFFTEKIIVHENFLKDILVKDYNLKADRIEVVYHGVEDLLVIPKKDACLKLNLDEKKDIILFMGYLTGYKGIDLLIEGFNKYLQINPNSFLLIGAGRHPKFTDDTSYLKEYFRLKNKAKELIPENNHRWIGFIEESDIVNYYSAADVSVYPYTIQMSSSGPISIAIGYEKPFLVSNVFDQVVDQDLVFQRVSSSLAAKVAEFFGGKDKYIQLIKKMKKERLWKDVGQRFFHIYLE